MKQIEVSEAVHAALHRLASEFHRTPDEVLASLLHVPAMSLEAADPLVAHVLSVEFQAQFTDAEKYLSLLSWIAARHASEFGEFIRSQSGRRYLGLSSEEILEACRRNHARQIDGTQYWAIMNIDIATKRRFLARVLEFIGYRDAVISFVSNVFGGPTRKPHDRLVA